MYQDQFINQGIQNLTGNVENQNQENLEWQRQEDIHRLQETTWIQPNYIPTNQTMDQCPRGSQGFQTGSYAQHSYYQHDPLFRPDPRDLMPHTRTQQPLQQEQPLQRIITDILPKFSSGEMEGLISGLDTEHYHGQQWDETRQSYNYSPLLNQGQKVVAKVPKKKKMPVENIPKKVVKRPTIAKKDIVTTKATKSHPGSVNHKIITTMITRPVQTCPQNMVSVSTQTSQLAEAPAPEIHHAPKYQKLYNIIRRMNRKEKEAETPSSADHAIRMAQAKQFLLQSFNIQIANFNKQEATAIFTLYSNTPFPTILNGTAPEQLQ